MALGRDTHSRAMQTCRLPPSLPPSPILLSARPGRTFAGHWNPRRVPVRRVTSSRARRNFRRRGEGEGTAAAAAVATDEGGVAGLWGSRGHLSVNGFCNWESVKLPNRPVHLLALLDELGQPPRAAAPPAPPLLPISGVPELSRIHLCAADLLIWILFWRTFD